MRVINAVNVNDALCRGVSLMRHEGEKLSSRAGDTLEIPSPVATCYLNPQEKVLINKTRDANPFFHLMESLWILAGRDDVKFLTEFNKQMINYSDDGEVFNAPYGYRLRTRFLDHQGCDADQLTSVIRILKEDPTSRQAVCQIWDTSDLERKTKDKACNMSIVFRIRDNKLCMTVYNRSNDMIWGAYGANVVQFSMIQEYVAAHIDIPVGVYTQVSNSYHVYTTGLGGDIWNRLIECDEEYINPYCSIEDMVLMRSDDIQNIEYDLKLFFNTYDKFGLDELYKMDAWKSAYFRRLIKPVLFVFANHKKNGPNFALGYSHLIQADDWRKACQDWLENRIK